MPEEITPEQVAFLARLAGFSFAPDRCALLAPQLAWLRAENARVNALDLAACEPVLVFRPDLPVPCQEPSAHG